MNNSRVIVALDFPAADSALNLVQRLRPGSCRLKVGKELFTSAGPGLVARLIDLGFDVFLDLKYHDIPNTVAGACRAAAALGVWMLNVHTSGGRDMLNAAREAVDQSGSKPLLIGVTLLTSLSDTDLQVLGINVPAADQVRHLAGIARDCGLDGVVCSAREAGVLSAALGRDFILVTPGIRPHGPAGDDQKRITTPAQAIHSGSHYLVIGRPVTAAADPVQVLEEINAEVVAACSSN